jgi:hypothetical protein
MPDVNFLSPQSRRGRGAKIVLSPRADEDDVSPSPRSRHSLIRPLAAGGPLKASTEQRFSRRWKAFADNDKVRIGAAKEQNAR